MTIDIQLIGAIGLCIAVTALALFVMLHSPTARVNRRFGVMAFVTGGWILAISLALAASDPATTVGLGRIGFAFASAIPVTLIWMVDSLSDTRTWTRRLRHLVPGCLCLVFVALSLGPWIVSGANPGVPRANFLYGPAHRWFGIYFLLVFATGIYTLWRDQQPSVGNHASSIALPAPGHLAYRRWSNHDEPHYPGSLEDFPIQSARALFLSALFLVFCTRHYSPPSDGHPCIHPEERRLRWCHHRLRGHLRSRRSTYRSRRWLPTW